jgi:hypothetical protein
MSPGNDDPKLFLVHCIDTEGPLREPLEATFDRLEQSLGIRLTPSLETFQKIRSGELDLGDKTEGARAICSPHNLDYNDSWPKVESMLDEILSADYRQRFPDSDGHGCVYNWFVMDHVGFDENPRGRDVGYHNIFDRYREKMQEARSHGHELHFHFHPTSTYRQGHICATSYLRSPHLLEALARRVIDRTWFPSCFRAGFYAERPDSHWFLEQWFPFDFSNNAKAETRAESLQEDIGGGRFGDWRRAPDDWSHYHPSHDDYQTPGNCRRTIFRALAVGTRMRLMTQRDVDAAFARVADGHSTVLAFSDHDYRDMRRDIEEVYSMVKRGSEKFPSVRWAHSGAKNAARKVLGLSTSPLDFDVKLESRGATQLLRVEARGQVFGPQPFLAVRTSDRRYINDNFDFQIPGKLWTYTFDHQSIHPGSFDRVGVGASSPDGSACVLVLDSNGGIVAKEQSSDYPQR